MASALAIVLVMGTLAGSYTVLAEESPAEGSNSTADKPAAAAPNPRLSGVLTRVGDTAAASGDHGTAIRLYRRAHKLAPNQVEPAIRLARAARALRDHRSAAAAYRAVLEIKPGHDEARRGLVRELIDLRAPREAIPHLQAVLRRNPQAWMHNELGIAYDMMGQHAKAQSHYRAGLSLAPRDLTLRTNLGRSLALAGKTREALDILRAVSADPQATPRHRDALALAHAAAGDYDSAIRARSAAAASGQVTDPRNYFAMLSQAVNSGDHKAIEDIVAASALHSVPGSADVAQPRRRAQVLRTLKALHSRRIRDGGPRVASRGDAMSDGFASDAAPRKAPNAAPRRLTKGSMTPRKSRISRLDPRKANLKPRRKPTVQTALARPTMVRPSGKGRGYQVQMGAYRSARRAERGWRMLHGAAPDLLDGIEHVVIKAANPGEPESWFYKLRTAAFDERGAAESLCRELKDKGLTCFVVRSSDGRVASLKPMAMAHGPVVYTVQLAAFSSTQRAKRGSGLFRQAAPGLLIDRKLSIRQARVGHPKDPIYRVRTMAFDNKKEADALCAELKDLGLDCLVFQSRGSARRPKTAAALERQLDPGDSMVFEIEDFVGTPSHAEGEVMDPFDRT